jgi:RNA polymerase sigma-70 factor, ECF subfamily
MSRKSRFEHLALPHMAAAYNLAYWILQNRPDAEDVVQDAYLRAFRAFDGFEGDDFRPWLLTIVRNAAYRALHNRKRAGNVIALDGALTRRAGEAEMLEIACDAPSAEDLLIGEGERRLVRSALADLPPVYREVLVLREMEGLSYRDISTVTATPIGTVMSRLARGRDELRKKLTRLMAKDEPNAM